VVEIVFTLAGNVEDYSDDDIRLIATAFAEIAGVDLSKVYVTLQEASVEVTVTIVTESAEAAANLKTLVETTLGTAAALESVLVAVGLDATVESGATAVVAVMAPPAGGPQFSTGGGSDNAGAIAGGVVGGVVGVGILAFLAMKFMGGGGKGGTQQV